MLMISIYKNVYEKETGNTINITDFLNNVKNGYWQDPVLSYRNEKIKKELLPAITASGFFPNERKNESLKAHSGFIVMDYDAKENPDLLKKRDEIYSDVFLYAAHVSVGGKGLALYFKIDKRKHIESFLALDKYLANKYNIITDQSCKNVSRLRFVSYDPELFINENAQKWTEYIDKKQAEPVGFNQIYCRNDVEYVISQIKQTGKDLTADYNDWLHIGLGLVSEYGEAGRSYFHDISRNYNNYNFKKTDKKYDQLLSSGSKKYKISTLFWLAKINGLKIKTPQTQKIQRVATIRKKEIGMPGGAVDIEQATENTIKYLTEIENINPEQAAEITEKVMQSNTDENFETSDIEMIIEYIKAQDIRYNEITQRIEFKNTDLTDRLENSIYLNCKAIFPKMKFSKDLISNIINSDRIPAYNPFFEFIEKNKHLKSNNLIDELLSCFFLHGGDNYNRLAAILIEKWLISLIASIHGTYSLLVLVLIGKQGTNKTNFFRYLLPDELQRYYAESKLDRDKDDELLMTQKLILVDDEFAGKSKKEAGKFKELSSKQTITARKSYGRYNEDYTRLAVLGGTSNEDDVVNDPTGNRRIIPILIDVFDFDKYIKIDKSALFIELYNKWKKVGNAWFLNTNEIQQLNEISERFMEISVEEEIIRKCFRVPKKDEYGEFFTATEMLNTCEAVLNKQRLYHKTFGKMLKKIGFERVQKSGVGYGYRAVKTL